MKLDCKYSCENRSSYDCHSLNACEHMHVIVGSDCYYLMFGFRYLGVVKSLNRPIGTLYFLLCRWIQMLVVCVAVWTVHDMIFSIEWHLKCYEYYHLILIIYGENYRIIIIDNRQLWMISFNLLFFSIDERIANTVINIINRPLYHCLCPLFEVREFPNNIFES